MFDSPLIYRFAYLFNAVLVSLDHFLNHLTADRTRLTRGNITVIALVQGNAYLVSRFHLKLFHSLLCLGHRYLISAHFISLPKYKIFVSNIIDNTSILLMEVKYIQKIYAFSAKLFEILAQTWYYVNINYLFGR